MKNSIIFSCLKKGNFILHSGQKSHFIFDIMKLIENEDFKNEFLKFIGGSRNRFIVGIEFGGAILSSMDAGCYHKFAIIRKDGTIYGNEIPDNYILLDDVVTTESSLRNAIKKIGKYPSEIKCIVDRRNKDKKFIHIESMIEFDEESYKNYKE